MCEGKKIGSSGSTLGFLKPVKISHSRRIFKNSNSTRSDHEESYPNDGEYYATLCHWLALPAFRWILSCPAYLVGIYVSFSTCYKVIRMGLCCVWFGQAEGMIEGSKRWMILIEEIESTEAEKEQEGLGGMKRVHTISWQLPWLTLKIMTFSSVKLKNLV